MGFKGIGKYLNPRLTRCGEILCNNFVTFVGVCGKSPKAIFLDRSGVVLLLTLWVILFLTVIGTTFVRLVRFETKTVGYQRDGTIALGIARAGFETARYNLMQDKNEYDGPDAEWRIFLSEVREDNGNKVKEAKRFDFKPDGELRGYYTLKVKDEDSKFPINAPWDEKLKEQVLKALLSKIDVKEPDPVIDSIMDWIDTDDLHRINGAEDSYYQGLKNPYHCKNGPLDTIEELLLIKGVTPDIFRAISEFLTVFPYSQEAKININTVSNTLLTALLSEMLETLAEDILNFRLGNDREEGTEDDQAFENPEQINQLPSWAAHAQTESGRKEVDGIRNIFKVKSSVFRIESTGILANDKARQRLTAVLEKTSDNSNALPLVDRKAYPVGKILYWQEG